MFEQKPVFTHPNETVADMLDRLDIKVSKIGSNSKDVALSILTGLDEVAARMATMETETSRQMVRGPYESITGKLRREAGPFMHDLGGAPALQKAREGVQPGQDRWWWYLDDYLTVKRKASLRRTLTLAGVILAAFVALAMVYKFFLAPDPALIGRFTHEEAARDDLMAGNYDDALAEVEQGLTFGPTDPTLLILRGIIREQQGNQEGAKQDFDLAKQGLSKPEAFFITRGQSYLMMNRTDKALMDAQLALESNPDSAQAYLLSGQAHESSTQFRAALEDYNKAFEAADKNQQFELAAISRTKIGMLMQQMGSAMQTPSSTQTAAPAP